MLLAVGVVADDVILPVDAERIRGGRIRRGDLGAIRGVNIKPTLGTAVELRRSNGGSFFIHSGCLRRIRIGTRNVEIGKVLGVRSVVTLKGLGAATARPLLVVAHDDVGAGETQHFGCGAVSRSFAWVFHERPHARRFGAAAAVVDAAALAVKYDAAGRAREPGARRRREDGARLVKVVPQSRHIRAGRTGIVFGTKLSKTGRMRKRRVCGPTTVRTGSRAVKAHDCARLFIDAGDASIVSAAETVVHRLERECERRRCRRVQVSYRRRYQ